MLSQKEKTRTTVQIDRMQTYDMNEGFKFNKYIYIYIIYYIYIVLTRNSSPPFFPSKRCHDSIFTYHDSGVGRYQIYTFGRQPCQTLKNPKAEANHRWDGGQTLVNTGDFNYQLPSTGEFAGVPDTPDTINESIVSSGNHLSSTPPPQKLNSKFTPEKLRIPIGKGSFEPTTIFQG